MARLQRQGMPPPMRVTGPAPMGPPGLATLATVVKRPERSPAALRRARSFTVVTVLAVRPQEATPPRVEMRMAEPARLATPRRPFWVELLPVAIRIFPISFSKAAQSFPWRLDVRRPIRMAETPATVARPARAPARMAETVARLA